MVRELMTVTQAANELGVSRGTVTAIIQREGFEAFTSRLNRRVRLLRAEDVRRLKEGSLIPQQTQRRPQVAAS